METAIIAMTGFSIAMHVPILKRQDSRLFALGVMEGILSKL